MSGPRAGVGPPSMAVGRKLRPAFAALPPSMAVALLLLPSVFAAAGADADEQIADLRQGTNISVAVAPRGDSLVVDLVGRLWRLPVSGGAAEPLTPSGEVARQPRFGPDGRQIVYQRLAGDQWDVWLLDLDSGNAHAVVEAPYDEREPDFSADGRSVVYASPQTGHYCLWSVALDGGVQTQLTEEPGDASFPSVSEQGLTAYVLTNGGQATLRVLTRNGVSSAVFAADGPLSSPSWRPGGDVLVFGEGGSAGVDRLRMLVLGDPPVLKTLSEGEDLFPGRVAWPSQAELIYTADGQLWRRGVAMPARRPVHLFAASAVESREPPLDLPALDAAGPFPALGINGMARSADGRRAAFTALGDLWLADRGDPRRLTDDPFVDLHPTFAPDGDSVVFASDRTGQFELWRIGLRDQRLTQLTFGATNPHRPAVSPDGRRVAFLATNGVGPWAAARLEVAQIGSSGESTTIATDVVGANGLAWSADGRALDLSAAVAHETGAMPVRLGGAGTAPDIEAQPRGAPARPKLEWRPPPADDEYVVQIGRLFDGVRGDYRRHVDLHVAHGKITAIVGRDVLPLPARVIDAREATVLPGLVDVHAHQSALAGEALGRTWLASGVTTVREIADDVGEALERGEAWASGRRLGPRLVITPSGGAPPRPGDSPAVPVRAYLGIADGFAHSIPAQARRFGIPGELQLAPPAGGADGQRYELAVSPRYATYQDQLSAVIASSTFIPSTLGSIGGPSSWPRLPALGASAAAIGGLVLAEPPPRRAPALSTAALASLEATVARLVRGGGHVAVGSDAPTLPYGSGVHLELEMLAAAGIPNDQVLRIATAEGALALGLERQLGTLEEGKLADFVVVDGDPLARLADSEKVTAVIKSGVWLDRQTLLARP
ncbi:MAG TPA: amidohydrolase family protein [Gammaproteobacteria bacterium]|nr:amidohydrolase family protein [Gammaproteobacteria bacterium]